MHRRMFLFSAVALSIAGSASAQSVQDEVVATLKSQGYQHIRISRTLLGRTRIFATGPNIQREIIINPATGEVLRDYWTSTGRDSRDRDRDDRDNDRREDRRDDGDKRDRDERDDKDDRDNKEDRDDDRDDVDRDDDDRDDDERDDDRDDDDRDDDERDDGEEDDD